MTAALAHRGPHGKGVWSRDAVGLGHRMLWTTPESRTEPLPFTVREKPARDHRRRSMDNREELRSVLDLDPRSDTIGDAALILAAYERWGQQCAERLRATSPSPSWDGRRRRGLLRPRPFGVKPFYYHHAAGLFALRVREIKALLHLPDVPRRLNETRVADYLAPSSKTARRSRLRRASSDSRRPNTLRVSGDGAEIRCYWALDPRARSTCARTTSKPRRFASSSSTR